MVSMLAFCNDMQELLKVKKVSKASAAVISHEKWKMEFYNILEKFKEKINQGERQDIICYELQKDEGINYAKYLRKCYEQAMLIVMADASVPPTEYIKPDIMPAGLIIKPFTEEEAYKVIREVFENYVEKIVSKSVNKTFIVSNIDGKMAIPYKDIIYFVARNKKIYIRCKNEEIGFCESLDNIEADLNMDFVRTHRSYLVNRSMIRQVKLSQNIVILNSSMEIPLSRKYKNIMKEIV